MTLVGFVSLHWDDHTSFYGRIDVLNAAAEPLITPATQVRSLSVVQPGSIMLFPNPATHTVNIEFESLPGSSLVLDLIDVTGKLVGHQTVQTVSGTNTFEFDTSHLPAGIYCANIGGFSVRFVIQD
jgi:hypothetical protein